MQLRKVMNSAALSKTLKKSLSLDGNRNGAKFIDIITDNEASSNLLKVHNSPTSEELAAREALGLVITGNLHRYQYDLIRKKSLMKGHKLFPSWKKVPATCLVRTIMSINITIYPNP